MKKAGICLLFLTVSVVAQDRDYHIGNRETKIAYSLGCKEAEKNLGGEMLMDKADVLAKGYTIGAKCTPYPKTKPPAPVKPVSLIHITSDTRKFAGKTILVRASITISTLYVGNFADSEKDRYAFGLRDDTGSLLAYMERGSAAEKLRNILLIEGRGKDVIADVVIRIPDNPYSDRKLETEAYLLSYSNVKIWDD